MNRNILITGASGNLGGAVVKKFLAENFKVIGTVIPHDRVLIDIDDENFEKIEVDLFNEENSAEFVKNLFEKYGQLDAAVLTVGGFTMGTIAKTKTADISDQIKLNFEAAYNVARPVFIKMLENKKGLIFLVGSKPGLDPVNGKGMVAYALSKSLLFRLAALMNDEAKGTVVHTSIIVPSIIDTPQNRKAMPEADFSSWVKPSAIAGKIYFNCTNPSSTQQETIIKMY